jgi:fermentation-respiration switch protein FrsA (DUF1100 family)
MRLRLLLAMPFILLAGCTHLLFQPMQQHVVEPAKLGINTQDVIFETRDQVKLHGWFMPAKGSAQGTVLFLHGNAENISTHISSVYWLPDEGFNVFLFDYRGYGRSEGEPSLAGLRTDLDAALETVFARPDVDPERVVVFGQSMGGAAAITGLANSPYKSRIRALVVEGVPMSFRLIAREKLSGWWLTWPFQWPLSLTIDDSDSAIEHVAEISPTPLLVVHSRDDQVIPFHHGEDLYQAAKRPKEFWEAKRASHIAVFRNPETRKKLVDYLREAMNRPKDQVSG